MIRIQHQFRMIPIMSRRACHSNQIVYPCLPTVYWYILYSYGPQRSLLPQRCTCVELHHSFAKKTESRLSKKKLLPFGNLICQQIILHLPMMLWCSFESAFWIWWMSWTDFFLFSWYEWIYYTIYYNKKNQKTFRYYNGYTIWYYGYTIWYYKTTWNSLQVIILFQPSFGSSFHVPLQCPGVTFHRRTALFLEDALAVLTASLVKILKITTQIRDQNMKEPDLDRFGCWMTLNDVERWMMLNGKMLESDILSSYPILCNHRWSWMLNAPGTKPQMAMFNPHFVHFEALSAR